MRVLIFILGALLTYGHAFADPSVSADWECSSSKSKVSVSYDSDGKIQFDPDIFNSSSSVASSSEFSKCIASFQRSVDAGVAEFIETQCPASKAGFCYASRDYTNGKIAETIQHSKLLKKNSGINVTAISPGAAAVIAGISSTPKTYLEEQIVKKNIDPKDLNQTFNYRGKSYKLTDFDDVIGENIENVMATMSMDASKQYAQNYMLANSQYLKSSQNPDKRKAVLDNLNSMFGYIYADKAKEELAKILECAPEDNLKPIANILDQLNKNKKVAGCNPLAAGEFKVFKRDMWDPYRTGDYLLRRKADGNYQAVVNVKYQRGGGSLDPQAMLSRAKTCLETASPYMKGPDGTNLEIVVMNENEINSLPRAQRPQQRLVTIEKENFRSNSGAYSEDVPCAVIAHETLHILGLVDEYHESEIAGYECRVESSIPSIMKSQGDMFKQVFGSPLQCSCNTQACKSIMTSSSLDLKEMYVSKQWFEVMSNDKYKYCKQKTFPNTSSLPEIDPAKAVAVLASDSSSIKIDSRYISETSRAPFYSISRTELTCVCNPSDGACLQFVAQVKQKIQDDDPTSQCPPHTSQKGWGTSGQIYHTELSPDVITLVSNPKRKSLLHPTQFNKILVGTCPSKDADGYNECSKYAYTSSKSPECRVPPQCRDMNYYLGENQ